MPLKANMLATPGGIQLCRDGGQVDMHPPGLSSVLPGCAVWNICGQSVTTP